MAVMLRALCLDLMGTVLYDPYVEALKAATGLDVPDARRFANPDSWPQFEIAAIDEEEFARRFFAPGAEGHAFDLEAFHRVRLAGYRWMPGMRELVTGLNARLRCYVASNYPVWIEDLRVAFELDEHFDAVWASHHLGVRKPDAEFYRRLLEAIRHDPGECLFVDDQRRNCEAAEAAGMQAHLFVDAEGLARRLRAEGVPV